MNADDIDRDQADRLRVALFPGVNFLVRLMKRMETKGFPPADQMFQLVAAAYERSYRLSMDLHYRSCSGAHQPTPHPSGDKADLTEGVVMKSEIRVKAHAVLHGVNVVEVWHDVCAHRHQACGEGETGTGRWHGVNVMEVGIAAEA